MKNYKFKRKTDLVRARGAYYYIDSISNHTYFAKDNEFRTIEEGSWYHLDGRYILCSEDVMSYIYK